jgi:16S rRNA processing protein RimM
LDGFLGLYIEDEDASAVQPGSTVYLDDNPHRVRALRRVDRGYQVAFEGIDDRPAAEDVRGLDVTVESPRDLEEGEFWPGDLIGLAVHDQAGNRLGTVVDVRFGAGQERLAVEMVGGSTFEVPFVSDLVPVVDLAGHRIEIVAIPGLTEPSD